MGTTSEVTLIQLLYLGRPALQQKLLLHLALLLMAMADKRGAPDQLGRCSSSLK